MVCASTRPADLAIIRKAAGRPALEHGVRRMRHARLNRNRRVMLPAAKESRACQMNCTTRLASLGPADIPVPGIARRFLLALLDAPSQAGPRSVAAPGEAASTAPLNASTKIKTARFVFITTSLPLVNNPIKSLQIAFS